MTQSFRTLALFSAFALVLCLPHGARAQGLILPQPVRAPNWQPLTVHSQKVTIQLVNGVAKVEVEQVFYNPNGVPMEGTYLFPLPEGAVVSHFRMLIDREPTEGKLLSVDEARRVYESYVRRRVDPAILEYVGRNAFQARIFPIPAASERRIYLSYSQAAEFSGGIYGLTYPLNSERVSAGNLGELSIDCSIQSQQPIRSVYSPTYEIQVRRDSETSAHAVFTGKDVRPNRDFLLYYSTSDRAFGLNALTHRRPGEDGYLMLMLAPKQDVAASEVLPKDVVVVFDTSGSMEGPKLEQAKQAALTILGALNERDRFNVLRFSTDVTSFRPTVAAATPENRAAARAFVQGFQAIGGTDIDEALEQALASFPKPEDRRGRSPFLIFMTDGLPTVGVTDIGQVLKDVDNAAPKDLRMFPFGVGSDVNTLLLDRLARDHGGAADYVAEDEDLETRIGSFYAKIANPVLSNVHVSLSGGTLLDPYPSHLPDLFAGTQLLVLARYRGGEPGAVKGPGAGKGVVTLTGDLNGKPQKYSYEVSLPERDLGQEFLPKLWAGRRIGFLLEEIRLHGENKELKDEVVRLSEEYGIVTPYTSYLVVEPNAVPQSPPVGGRPGTIRDLSPVFATPLSAAPPGLPTGTLGGGGGRGGFGGGSRGGLGFGGGVPSTASGISSSSGAGKATARPTNPGTTDRFKNPGVAPKVPGVATDAEERAQPHGGPVRYGEQEQLQSDKLLRSNSQKRVANRPETTATTEVRLQELSKGSAASSLASKPVRKTSLAHNSLPRGAKVGSSSGIAAGAREAKTPPAKAAAEAQIAAMPGQQAQQYRQQAEGFKRSTGWNSVEASRRVQQLKDKAQSDTDVEVAHTIDGRGFRFAGGMWKDQTATGKLTFVRVQYGSEAYFQLITAKPQWARFLAQGHAVTFRTGRETAVSVAATGKTRLSAAELQALER